MLLLTVGAFEQYDEEKNEFIDPHPFDLKLEHSLLSISKWESIWKKPFLHMTNAKGEDTKTEEQTLSYIKCMTLNANVPDEVYDLIGPIEKQKINEYINSDHTATWFSDVVKNQKGGKTTVTSELMYYWMVANQIPWEAQKWNLSRFYTLIQICNLKNEKEKKMSKTDVMRRNRDLNAARRAANNSKG